MHLACGILRRDNAPAPLVLELTSYHNHSGARRVFSFLPFLGAEERTIQLTDAEAPHAGQLDYERFCTIITGAQWRLNTRKALDALRTRHHRFVQAPGVVAAMQRNIG